MSADRCSNTGGFALLGIGGANPNVDDCHDRSTLLHRTEMHSCTNTTQRTHQSTIRTRPAVFNSILVSLPDLGYPPIPTAVLSLAPIFWFVIEIPTLCSNLKC